MIGEIVRAVFPPSVLVSARFVTIFTAHLDASRGEGSDADAYTVAGFIADADRWDAFEVKWTEALGDFGLSAFHMTDFENCFGEFKDWKPDDPRRVALLTALFDVINDYTIGSIAYGVSQTMFDSVVSPAAARLSGGPYFFLFIQLIFGSEDVMAAVGAPSDWRMAYMLARGDPGLGQLIKPWMSPSATSTRLDAHVEGLFIPPRQQGDSRV